MSWLKDLCGTEKPIIGMCHFIALPGDPNYDSSGGMELVIKKARADLQALQNGGVDSIMFSNEGSLPYLTNVEPITISAMAGVIGELKSEIKIPFGVNVLWDPMASLDLAVATNALFVREIFTGVYASDFGLWNTNPGAVIRHQHAIDGSKIKTLFNIVPESAVYLGKRNIEEIAISTVFNTQPDALCVSGVTAGQETSISVLNRVKNAVPNTKVFANTGVKVDNLEEQLKIADGAVVGTTFKRAGFIWNEVDELRVQQFMTKVRSIRRD